MNTWAELSLVEFTKNTRSSNPNELGTSLTPVVFVLRLRLMGKGGHMVASASSISGTLGIPAKLMSDCL